jgi:hypothetical protein
VSKCKCKCNSGDCQCATSSGEEFIRAVNGPQAASSDSKELIRQARAMSSHLFKMYRHTNGAVIINELIEALNSATSSDNSKLEALEWMLKDYRGIVESGFPPSANACLRIKFADEALAMPNSTTSSDAVLVSRACAERSLTRAGHDNYEEFDEPILENARLDIAELEAALEQAQ